MADSLKGGIVINEILVDPNGATNFDTDNSGTFGATDEFIELYNDSASAIDISGFELWDAGVDQWFVFPPGTILQPGAHALVMSGVETGGTLPTGGPNDLAFSAGRNSPLINNPGDNVVVYDPGADEFIQATFNGDALDDPTAPGGDYAGFSPTATRSGAGEDFGNDTDGFSLQRQGDGQDSFALDTPTPATTNVCFANGSHILTPTGERPVEMLRAGDAVLTRDNGPQVISWVYSKTWSAAEIRNSPNLAAVLIRKDALAPGIPNQDLRLSRQHRVLVQGAIAQRMYGCRDVLIPAHMLLRLPGVTLDAPKSDLSYFHIMLDQHEILVANAVQSESLYLGPEAIKAIPQAALDDLQQVLDVPLSVLVNETHKRKSARTLAEGKKAKRLIARHAKNNRPIVTSGLPYSVSHLT